MKGLWNDCRHALRLYVRTPGASLIAVLVLAVGVAFVGAFLSLYVDLILRPHPGFEQSGRIATVGQRGGPSSDRLIGIPFEIVQRMTDEMASIESVAVAYDASVLLGPEREPATIELVSAQFFNGLRPRLARGRGLSAADHAPESEPVAVISHRLWRQWFDGDPNAIGTVIEVAHNPNATYWVQEEVEFLGRATTQTVPGEPERETTQFRIVGVMTEDLTGVTRPETSLWVSIERAFPLFVGFAEMLPRIPAPTYVRMRPRVSSSVVADELDARYASLVPEASVVLGMKLDAIEGIVQDIAVQRDSKRQLQLFLAGSVLLAVVAAANVSLFLLARAPGRRRELGIRMAVGAPIRRLARQLATEACLFVVISSVLGIVMSIWLGMYLRGLSLLRDAEWSNVTLLDWRVLGLGGAFLLILTILVTWASILGTRQIGIAATSRAATARASLAQRLAGTAQIAVAGALGGAAVALGWYVGTMMFGDPGYRTADRYMVTFDNGGIRPGSTLEAYIVELARRREVIESIPGVTAAAFGTPVPGQEQDFIWPLRIADPDDPSEIVQGQIGMLDGRFIDVLGLRLIHGRAPRSDDSYVFGESVALVNRSLARALWGREDVVGERLPVRAGNMWSGAEVIGVLEDLSFEHPSAAIEPYLFVTLDSRIGNRAVIQTGMTAAGLKRDLERIESAGALETQVGNILPLKAMRNELIVDDRARGFLTITAALLVVFMAAFGFYGTQRYLVAAGRREYAIRASLGAGPGALGRLVLWRGLLLGLPGLVLGGLLAFIVVGLLEDDFVSPDISATVVTAVVVTSLIGLLVAASLGPAHEARHTQPAPLLRED